MSDEPVMTPITPDEAANVPPKVSPFTGSAAPASAASAPAPATPAPAPASAAPAAPGGSTIKLKPVIRKPMIHKPVVGGAKPAAPAPADPAAAAGAKKATQNLKSVTGPIPAQATLRKTGIIAEGIITPQQQQAAKSKTSRISLESAIGVAPVKEAAAPLKTIRLRRPTDLKPATPAAPSLTPEPAKEVPPPVAAAVTEVPSAAPAETPASDAGVTQKKTLKLHRPGGVGIKRPTLGVNRPQEAAAPGAAEPATDSTVGELAAVPELTPISSMSMAESGASTVAGVPSWVAVLSLVTSLAALVAIGVVVWYLWQEGVGPVVGANEMPFLQM